MANLMLVGSGADTDLIPNVTHPVGIKRTNLRDDVVLVQALCAIIFDSTPLIKSPLKHLVDVTGSFDHETEILVKHYQRVQQRRIHIDGEVSPARSSSGRGRGPHRLTIISMAFTAELALNKSGLKLLDALRTFPELAGALDPSLVFVP